MNRPMRAPDRAVLPGHLAVGAGARGAHVPRRARVPNPAGRWIARGAAALALFGALCSAAAQSASATDALAPWRHALHQFTLDAARHASTGQRVEVELGALDPRVRLTACERAVPFLPDAARLWGRSRVGLRCERGATWRVFVPATVHVYGTALAAAAALPAGRALVHADLVQANVDLAETQSQVVTDPQLALGRVLQRPLAAGQALRADHLKARVWFDAGDAVKVVARGNGFSAVGSGIALTSGVEGQLTRVKTESGRVLSGRAVASGTIDVML